MPHHDMGLSADKESKTGRGSWLCSEMVFSFNAGGPGAVSAWARARCGSLCPLRACRGRGENPQHRPLLSIQEGDAPAAGGTWGGPQVLPTWATGESLAKALVTVACAPGPQEGLRILLGLGCAGTSDAALNP